MFGQMSQMIYLFIFFWQTERGSAVSEENHWRKEGGDQKAQPKQPGKQPGAEIFHNTKRNGFKTSAHFLKQKMFYQQKERLRQKEANLSLPS